MEPSDITPITVPYVTSALPGVGGRIKARFEDFVVDEVLAYEPCGEGPHVYVWVEKRDVTTPYATKQLANYFGVDKRDIGYAGMKDRHGVTRQWFSLPAHHVAEEALERAVRDEGAEEIVAPGVWVRRATRHGNKIKRGHVRGNHFEIVVRDLEVGPEEAARRVAPICAALAQHGVPNFFGSQRFGKGGSTLTAGLAVVRGDEEAARWLSRDRRMKRLSVSAVQSEVFNRMLAERALRDELFCVEEGVVVQKRDTGGVFTVGAEDVEDVAQRMAAGSLVVMGPMVGPKMRAAGGAEARREREVLEGMGLEPGDFERVSKLAPGARRPYVTWPVGLEWSIEENEEEGASLRLRFFLSSGSYATILVREVSKGDDTRA